MTNKSDLTLWQLLENAPSASTAIIASDLGVSLTYGSLREEVTRVADLFASAGIRPGERIAIALPNGIPALVCMLAASIAGASAPLNPGYKAEEFDFYLQDTEAKLLVLPARGGEEARKAAGEHIPIVTADLDHSARVAISQVASKTSVLPPTPERTALILHTSGSTGRPKRVPLMHSNLTRSAQNVASTYQLTGNDVSLCVMPLFHVHGLVASVLAAFVSGGTVVIPSKFNALSFWRVAHDHRATWFSAVPTIHQLLITRAGRAKEHPEGARNLRFIRSCSAPLSAALMQQMENAFGAPVLEAYGMTEASHQMASNPLPPLPRKAASVGVATGIEIGIMDDNGNHLAQDQTGEVVIKGDTVIKGYENNPEANAKSFADGWFRTGDQGVLDESGYLRLTGRLKELINRGGEKISPVEVDEVLLGNKAVAEAVSFAIPHPTWGEEVAAAVVLREPLNEQEIVGYCKDRLAEYKCPKKIYIVEAIPRTATGKVQRRVVAATLGPRQV